MVKSAAATVKEIMSRLQEQAQEMAHLRAALDVQFKRMAYMQAELNLLPLAHQRRQTLRALLTDPPRANGHDSPGPAAPLASAAHATAWRVSDL